MAAIIKGYKVCDSRRSRTPAQYRATGLPNTAVAYTVTRLFARVTQAFLDWKAGHCVHIIVTIYGEH